MNYGFKRIKDQIKPRDEVVNDTIERSKHIKRDHPLDSTNNNETNPPIELPEGGDVF